ncbi:MAG: Stp1/IreP family PP2C-type Ser/Thr phosphatase [Microscillaceae bacterium]|nr:Stp1/IreP family PP2C-type Ser/Thr phosphatase [Microscillaceae bacterium]
MDTQERKDFRFGNFTDIGKVRSQNEDYLGYFENQNGDFFVVCDGMGGHAGGAIASQTAFNTIRSFFENQYYTEPFEAIHQAIQYANQQIYQKSQMDTSLRGMGTTCVLLMIREGMIYYGHVGDSRIYLHNEGILRRLTSDHSLVQALIDQGLITEKEAEKHPRKNELLRAVGTGSYVDVTVPAEPILPQKGDIFLLCSDGLTSLVSDEGIEEILNMNLDVQQKAIKLVDLANTLGGFDNTTVQIIEFVGKGKGFQKTSASNSVEEKQYTRPNNFNPPSKAQEKEKNESQYIEPLSEEFTSDFKRKKKADLSMINSDEVDYRPLMLRGFLIVVAIVAIYLFFNSRLSGFVGSTGTAQGDSLRAIEIEQQFYEYFWNSSSGLKKVKNSLDKTKKTFREIQTYKRNAVQSVKRYFKDKRVRYVANTLEENQSTAEKITDLAQKHRSKIEWILKANGVSKAEELNYLDTLAIPLEEPEL